MDFLHNPERLGRIDKLEIIRILLNHFTRKANTGQKEYRSKILSMYKFGLEKNILTNKGQIGEATFTNITTIGILEKEYNWVEQFVADYNELLPQSIRENIVCLTLSLLSFYKKDYSKTIDLILTRQFSKPLYALKSKSILLRAYFEQYLLDDSYYDLLIAQTHSFEKFVRRNDLLSIDKKEIYINFILYTRKIAHAFHQNEIDSDLLNTIKNTNSVILKSWLLEKVKQKKKRPSN